MNVIETFFGWSFKILVTLVRVVGVWPIEVAAVLFLISCSCSSASVATKGKARLTVTKSSTSLYGIPF